MNQENLIETFKSLKKYGDETVKTFKNQELEKSYVDPTKIPSLPNSIIRVPANIEELLIEFGKLNTEHGREISYYLIGLDNRRGGNTNEVIISSLIFSSSESIAGNNVSCSFGQKMTTCLNEQLEPLWGQKDVIVFQGHTHPRTAYSNNFSLLDLANIRKHSVDTPFQLAGFLVCPSNQTGDGKLIYRSVFYEKKNDSFYQFSSFQSIKNQGLIINADKQIESSYDL